MNRASRVASKASQGLVLASASTWERASASPGGSALLREPLGVAGDDLGEFEMKGVAGPMALVCCRPRRAAGPFQGFEPQRSPSLPVLVAHDGTGGLRRSRTEDMASESSRERRELLRGSTGSDAPAAQQVGLNS